MLRSLDRKKVPMEDVSMGLKQAGASPELSRQENAHGPVLSLPAPERTSLLDSPGAKNA
jgi:hypothetical protein